MGVGNTYLTVQGEELWECDRVTEKLEALVKEYLLSYVANQRIREIES